VLASSGERARSRERLLALLWPDRDTEHARNLLNQAVYSLRKALGDDAIRSVGDDLRLNPGAVAAGVVDFEAALARGSHAAAATLYHGPFLDGFFLSDAPEFEHWAAGERDRLAAAYARALEALAEGAGDVGAAVDWWKARAAHDPFDSRVALRLMQALEAGGNPAGALQHAGVHARLLQAELGVDPAPEMQALTARLRRARAAHAQPEAGGRDNGPGGAAGGLTLVHAGREFLPPSEPSVIPVGAPMAGRPPAARPLSRPTDTREPTADVPFGLPSTAPRSARRRSRSVVQYGVAALVLCAGLVTVRFGLTRRARDVADSEDELARVVGRALDQRLGPAAPTPRPRPSTRNVVAYDLYRRASDPARLRSDSAAREALALLQQAVALDSTYAAAWAGLALMQHRVGLLLPPGEREPHRELAERAARTAVALDDALVDAHLMMGLVRMVVFDFASAELHLTRAVALDPSRADAHEQLVTLYLWTGRPAEALAQAERAVTLDPLSPSANAEAARALLGLDRCDDALARLETLAELRPPLQRVSDIAAQCYARQGRWTAAVAALRPRADRGDPTALAQTAYMLARAGRRTEARSIRAALLTRWRRGDVGAFPLGVADAGLGDLDQALAWFERAVGDGSLQAGHSSPGHLMLVLPGPLADDLRHHPGIGRLRERLGLPRQ
jgi:DNA-binding SARP family transcriptional activator